VPRSSDRDDRRFGLRDLGRDLVIAHPSAIGGEHAHPLGGIYEAAAADRDEAVEIAVRQTCGAISMTAVVGSATVSENTFQGMPARSSSSVAAEMPGTHRKGR